MGTTHLSALEVSGSFAFGGSTAVAATSTEINNSADISARMYAVGSALSITQAAHAERVGQLDTAAGSTATLPASTGSGAVYTFMVTVLATSNSHIVKVANATDVMVGYVLNRDTDTGNAFAGFNAATNDDTVTLNRSTTGSVTIGEVIRCTDVKAGTWLVEGWTTSTGVPATPFSATVA